MRLGCARLLWCRRSTARAGSAREAVLRFMALRWRAPGHLDRAAKAVHTRRTSLLGADMVRAGPWARLPRRRIRPARSRGLYRG
jgi:hypothetical protein